MRLPGPALPRPWDHHPYLLLRAGGERAWGTGVWFWGWPSREVLLACLAHPSLAHSFRYKGSLYASYRPPSLPARPILLWGSPVPILSAHGWGGPRPSQVTLLVSQSMSPRPRFMQHGCLSHTGPRGPSWDLGWNSWERRDDSPRDARLAAVVTGAQSWSAELSFLPPQPLGLP